MFAIGRGVIPPSNTCLERSSRGGTVRAFVFSFGLTLAACSDPHAPDTDTDINAVAAEAQGDIDTYAANALAAQRSLPVPASTVAPPDPVAEPLIAPASAQGAANVVQTYFAMIDAGRYVAAWRLWGDAGHASGMTASAFAASFAEYAAYHAEVGAPGAIEAGAGQRYVTVPVRTYGTLRTGRQPFELHGMFTLHRTEVDGATAEQRMWRISDAALKPRAAVTTAAELDP